MTIRATIRRVLLQAARLLDTPQDRKPLPAAFDPNLPRLPKEGDAEHYAAVSHEVLDATRQHWNRAGHACPHCHIAVGSLLPPLTEVFACWLADTDRLHCKGHEHQAAAQAAMFMFDVITKLQPPESRQNYSMGLSQQMIMQFQKRLEYQRRQQGNPPQ